MTRRLQIEAGPLTVALGLFFRLECSLSPLALVAGPLALMWTPSLPAWRVSFWR